MNCNLRMGSMDLRVLKVYLNRIHLKKVNTVTYALCGLYLLIHRGKKIGRISSKGDGTQLCVTSGRCLPLCRTTIHFSVIAASLVTPAPLFPQLPQIDVAILCGPLVILGVSIYELLKFAFCFAPRHTATKTPRGRDVRHYEKRGAFSTYMAGTCALRCTSEKISSARSAPTAFHRLAMLRTRNSLSGSVLLSRVWSYSSRPTSLSLAPRGKKLTGSPRKDDQGKATAARGWIHK